MSAGALNNKVNQGGAPRLRQDQLNALLKLVSEYTEWRKPDLHCYEKWDKADQSE